MRKKKPIKNHANICVTNYDISKNLDIPKTIYCNNTIDEIPKIRCQKTIKQTKKICTRVTILNITFEI